MKVWQAERDNSETANKREWMNASVCVYVCIQALRVLSCMFLPLSVRVLRATVIGVSSTLDWFENIDKMSPVWKPPIYKPSSRNFREKPAPSKSEWEFVATNGSEVGKPRQAKQSDTSLKAACYLGEALSLVILLLSLTLSLYLSLFLVVSRCLSFVRRSSFSSSLCSPSFSFTVEVNLSHGSVSKGNDLDVGAHIWFEFAMLFQRVWLFAYSCSCVYVCLSVSL